MASLVSFAPEGDDLPFTLEYDKSPVVILRMHNKDENKEVSFKMKTTQPEIYLVKPNFGVIAAGGSVEVAVVLLDVHCNSFIEMNENGNAEDISTHRFKVQLVGDKVDSEGAKRWTEVWDSCDKENRQQKKFTVNYTYSAEKSSSESLGGTGIAEASGSRGASASYQNEYSYNAPQVQEYPSRMEDILSELQGMRQKYDKIIEMTLHLTSEKDQMADKLNQMETERESKLTALEQERKVLKSHSRRAKKGTFSFAFLFFAALLSCIAGFVFDRYKVGAMLSSLTSEL